MTQVDLAARLGLSKQTLAARNNAAGGPTPAHAFAVEGALGMEPGRLSRLLGYVPAEWDPPTVLADVLDADPLLGEKDRRMLLTMYRSLVGLDDDE